MTRTKGEFLLGLSREVREGAGAGVRAGDEVDVVLELDAAPREVEEARREETRQRRVQQAVEMIKAGQPRS